LAAEDKKLIYVHPCMDCGCDCGEIDEDHYHISIELPGVEKKDIDLKIIKSGLRLRAKKGKNIEYVSELQFLCDAKTDKIKADYKNGLLSIDIPFDCIDPFKEVESVKIS
jgi:HSP20 family molecular chaperone IbpA